MAVSGLFCVDVLLGSYSLTHAIAIPDFNPCLSDSQHEADTRLFQKMVKNKHHCIHQLLPPVKILPMKLCPSHCLFALPQYCHFDLCKRSFVLRSLFDDYY